MQEVKLQNIDFKYPKGELIFNNFTLTFNKGDFVFLLGANGSGKSTLLKLLLNAYSPQKGEIIFNNKNDKPLSSLIGYIPQSYSLDPEMHVIDTIRFMASLHGVFGVELKDRMSFLANSLGIEKILKKKVKELSGGQKQLTNIAIGLIHDPEIILLDEPFVGLDYKVKSDIISTLKSINKTRICISHDMDIAENYADRIILLDKGKVVEEGEPKALIKNNPYSNYEITFKENVSNNFNFSEGIYSSFHQNTLTLTLPEKESFIHEVDEFQKQYSDKIGSIRVNKNSLKSTIIGLHKLELSERKEKKVKGGRGNGQGGGKNKNKK